MLMKTHLRPGFLILVLQLLLPGLAVSQGEVNGLVVFGDSLSDTGNKYFETGFANRPPYSELLDFFPSCAKQAGNSLHIGDRLVHHSVANGTWHVVETVGALPFPSYRPLDSQRCMLPGLEKFIESNQPFARV